jgi:hypothetical protein
MLCAMLIQFSDSKAIQFSAVIASQRVAQMRAMTGSAKQSIKQQREKVWIASLRSQ